MSRNPYAALGLTVSGYQQLLIEQGNDCKLCSIEAKLKPFRHGSGFVLLCCSCYQVADAARKHQLTSLAPQLLGLDRPQSNSSLEQLLQTLQASPDRVKSVTLNADGSCSVELLPKPPNVVAKSSPFDKQEMDAWDFQPNPLDLEVTWQPSQPSDDNTEQPVNLAAEKA